MCKECFCKELYLYFVICIRCVLAGDLNEHVLLYTNYDMLLLENMGFFALNVRLYDTISNIEMNISNTKIVMIARKNGVNIMGGKQDQVSEFYVLW